ncbi:MAG: hypothetical protein JNM59_00880 [Hyphomonadaceae bacterium]|nr:hypothetical protein [Hyphomonadaceae bacterium]
MKNKVLAAAMAALALGAALPAAAQDRYRGHDGYVDTYRGDSHREWNRDDHRGGRWRFAEITIRKDGRTFAFDRDDRLFYRLLERPYRFVPGLTYQYTDRCNRNGCVVFVYDRFSRRPIDRIFAPHLPLRNWAWRDYRGFDQGYRQYGYYDRDDRRFDDQWRYRDDDRWEGDDDRWDNYLEGGRGERMR